MDIVQENVGLKNNKAYNGIYNRFIKRVLGFLIALTSLIILWPVFFIVGVMVVVDSRFPIFYRAERGGYKNKPFKICKFRTMVKDADTIGGGTTALNDDRITKVGMLLRKTKLDEIPQIFQVLTGKMSFIGPRPELMQYVSRYEGEEMDILQVRPGITDFSSIEFIDLDEIVGSNNADEVYEKVVLKRKNELRLKYAHSVSITTDIKILFITVFKVIKKGFKFLFRKDYD